MPEEHYISDHVTSKPGKPIPRSHTVVRRHAPKLGNPTPLGLSAFALSVMVVSFYNMQTRDVVVPNVVVGVSMFTGGVVQFAAGMWEFRVGNTFGGTGFSAFGGFWTSFGALYIPSFGIEKAFEKHFYSVNNILDPSNSTLQWDPNTDSVYNNALGLYCVAWLIFTFIFTLACIRTSVGVLSAFVFLTFTFLALSIGHFTLNNSFIKAGGILGLITSCIVWYCTAAVLLTPDLSPIGLPLGDLSRKTV
nr:10256_t:CDS:2 [Entrophospora candida]